MLSVKKTYWILIVFVLLTFVGNAQQSFKNDAERLTYANEQFDLGNYAEAKPHMSHFLGKNLENAEFNFKFGACLLFTDEDKGESLRYLRYAAKQGNVDSRVIFFLGKAYHLTYRFNEALIEYERFKKFGDDDDKERLQIELHISMAKNGKKLLKNLTELVVDDKKESSYERFQYSYDLSQIGGKILVTEEFQSKYDKKQSFRSLVYFPSKNQDIIFFSSYGKDGSNGLDLYKVRRLPNGDWSKSEILPSHINTPYDDSYGFLHSDGTTFYFCSKGHSSMGGYDVFKSSYDLETNTFGSPVNLDFKINTPDDDIMYVVDSLNDNAYFASARAAKGGYLDVYKVRVKTFPLLNVILAGTFINEINAADINASIKVENSATGRMEGEFHPNAEGKYIIVLPRAGKYKLIVETPESEKIHSGIVDIPPQKTLRALKQEVLLVNRNGQEQLIIRNLFDEEVENYEAILAQVINGLADPEVNADQFPDSLFVDKDDLLSDAVDINTSTDELKKMIDEMVLEDTKEVNDIEDKMNAAYSIAKKNSNEATETAKQAEEMLGTINSISDPTEKQQKIEEAQALHDKSKELNQRANIALNLGNNLKTELEEKTNELEESKNIATAIESALNQESHEKGVEELAKIQGKITDIVTRNTEDVNQKNAYDELVDKAATLQGEADKELADAMEYRDESDVLKNKVKNLETKKEKTKKQKDKDVIQVQIDELSEEKKMADQFAAESFAKNKEIQVEANDVRYQAELMDDLANNSLDGDLTFTDQEKAAIENEINSGNNEISSNENALSQFSENSTSSVVSNNTNETSNNTTVEIIDETTAYKEYEDEITETSDIENPVEKAQKENEINRNWIAILDEDIKRTTDQVFEETNETRKRKLENTVAALLLLKDEKEFLIDRNNKIIEAETIATTNETVDNTTETTNSNPLDDFTAYETQLSETNTISDPVEKAQRENEINNEILGLLDENIQDAKDQLVLEEDAARRTELESNIEELNAYKEKTANNIASNEQLIEEASAVAINPVENNENNETTETTTVEENPNKAKYEGYQKEIDALSSVSDPVERAEKENAINNQWLSDLKTEAKLVKDEMKNEEDGAKQVAMLMQVNSLFKDMSAVEGEIEKNEQIINDSDAIANESNLTEADDYKVLVNNLENEVVDETDFEKSFSNEKTYNNPEAQEKANSVEEKVDEIAVKEQEVASLENDLENESKEKKKAKIQSQLDKKRAEQLKLEEEVATELADANNLEKSSNNSRINELKTDAENREGVVEMDKKFVEAEYFEEKANENFEKASELRNEANNTSNNEEKSNLLKQANANELAGTENQEKSIAALEELNNEDYVADYITTDATDNTETNTTDFTDNTEVVDETNTADNIDNTETTDNTETNTTDFTDNTEVVDETNTTDNIDNTETTDNTETNTTDFTDNTEVIDETNTTDNIDNTETTDNTETNTTDFTDNTEVINETNTTDNIDNTETTDNTETNTTDFTDNTEVINETNTTDNTENTETTTVPEKFEVVEMQNEEVAGISFNPNEKNIETYEVSVIEEEKGTEDLTFTSSVSTEVIAKNQVEIDEIALINDDIEKMNEKLPTATEKEAKKINKAIGKLEKEKAKKDIHLAEVIETANKNEVDLALSGMNQTKGTADALITETFAKRQAEEYENAGIQLLADSKILRGQVVNEKDKIVKARKLNEAANKEAAAIEHFNKAKKLYAEAVVESYAIETENMETVETDEENRLSTYLLNTADDADAKAIEYGDKSSELRAEALELKKEEKTATNLEADKYEQLSIIKTEEAANYRSQGNKAKQQEDAIIEEEYLLSNLKEEEVEPILKSEEYKAFYEKQKEVVVLENEVKQEELNIKSYENLAKQQENKAKDLETKAAYTENETERTDLLAKATELRTNAEGNRKKKQTAEATVEDLYNSLALATEERNNTIANLDEDKTNDYKALVISNFDKNPIEEMVVGDVLASNFVPPTELIDNIYAVSTDMSYSDANPIPVNPGNPDGLIYKVQIGAFRKPIPQDLFKGFAPISAEVIRDGITRYRVGYFTAWEIANNAKNEIRGMGYSDAFVVAIYNGKYMPLAKARNLEKEGAPVSTNFVAVNNNTSTVSNNANNTNTTTNNTESTNTNTETNNTVPDYVANLGDGAASVEAVEVIEGLFFTVQIGAFSNPIQADNVFNVSPLVTKYVNNLYKYSTGIYRSVADAVVRKNEMIGRGLSDAFVTAYYNGDKISISKANQLIRDEGDAVFAISEGGTINKTTEPDNNTETNNVETTNTTPNNTTDVSTETTNTKMLTTAPTNVGKEYFVDLGTYDGSVPEKVAAAMLLMYDYKIETIQTDKGTNYVCGAFVNKLDAQLAKDKFELIGVTAAKIIEKQDGNVVGETPTIVAPETLIPAPVQGLEYRVFLGTYAEGVPQARSMIFLELDYLGIESTQEDEGMTYYCGKKGLYSEAEVLLKKFTDQGVGIARIVAFKDGAEIDVTEARKLTHE